MRETPLELPGHQEEAPDEPQRPRITLGDWLRLAVRAARRRKVIAALVFVAGLGASVAYYATRTPTYRVETKILAQRPQALPSVIRQHVDDVPTRSAWEMIHRRENLLAVIRETNLLPDDETEPPELTFREWLGRLHLLGRGPAQVTERDPLEQLVLLLDRKLLVLVDEGTITIQVDWPDAHEAHAIVEAALQNFLEARHLQEVTAIDEVISVLQGRAASLRKDVDDAMDEARRRPTQKPRPAVARPRGPSEDIVRLQSMLEAKQRAIQDVEEFRRRRLAELQAQLDQAHNTYSDAHPTVIGLRQQIEALSKESPQIEALREEERKGRREYADLAAREGVNATAPAPQIVEAGGPPEEDQRVREARLQYEQMNARVVAAQVDLDSARAAFKYRYNVIWPPQVPTEPVSPNPVKVLGAGAALAVLLALAVAAAPDVLRGRIVERWQVERGLDLPVLGVLERE